MSINETIIELDSVKQQDLNQTVAIARGGLAHSKELTGWINAFDKHLEELPFPQIDGKLQDVSTTATTGMAQCHETADKLLQIVGDTDNEHAKTAVQTTYNMGDVMGVSYWDDETIGVQLAVEEIQGELTALQEMVTAMREKMERVKGLADTIEMDFTVIGGSATAETLLKKLIRIPTFGKNDSMVAGIKSDITAYQQHLSK